MIKQTNFLLTCSAFLKIKFTNSVLLPRPALSIGLTFYRSEVNLPALGIFEIKYRQKSKSVWQNIEYYYNYVLILFISEKFAARLASLLHDGVVEMLI